MTTHVASWMTLTFPPLVTIDWWVGNVINSASRFCLPIFIMISGAALLNPAKQESTGVFFKKRTRRILVPTIFWSIFYLILKATLSCEQVTLKALATDILNVNMYYHMWYLYVAVGFYLLTPYLRSYVKNTERKNRIGIAVFMLIVGIVLCLINHVYRSDRHLILVETIPYLGYYLAGYELSLLDRKKINLKYIVIAIVLSVLVIIFGTALYINLWGTGRDSIFYHQLSLPAVVLSLSAFLLVYRICGTAAPAKGRVMNLTGKVVPTTMGIYILHPLILEIIHRIAVHFGADNDPGTDGVTALIGIPLVSLITIFLCYRISNALMKIPYLRRIIA